MITFLQKIKSFFNITNDVNEVPEVLKQKYLPSLDGLRALSILMVVGSHVLIGSDVHSALLYSVFNGALGVGIFFVISGFIITTLLMKELVYTKNISLKNFYIRRFLRIIPLAYFFLFVLIVLNPIFNMGIRFSNLLLAFLFLKNFVGSETDPATTHYWSLSVEEQYYLLFPYLFKKSRKFYLAFGIALTFIIIPAITWLHFHALQLNQNLFFTYLFMFTYKLPLILIGSVFAILFFRYSYLFKNYSGSIYSVLILAAIFVINSEFAQVARVKAFLFTNVITGILIAFLIGINVFENRSFVFKALNNKLVAAIGKLSYSIYVWQQIFTFTVPWYKLPNKPAGIVLLNLTALAVVAYLSYNYFEKPFLKLKQKFQIKKNITDGQILPS
ncbi:MAG: acyltransferase [Sphingobacteriaceae bacterium]|nr:MAG: acyltransferase [Sphingobacteriaceae bacterium]